MNLNRVIADMETQCFADGWNADEVEEMFRYEIYRYFIFYSDGSFEYYEGGDDLWFVDVNMENREMAGYAIISCTPFDADLERIAVMPKYRKKGYASLIMEKVFLQVKEEKLESIMLEVRKSNEDAINLYKNKGFESISERKAYYKNPVEDAIIMKKMMQ